MKTPQELAEEYAEKWNEGEPGDPDVAYTSFLAGYSVAMEQKRDILNEVLEYDYQHLLKHRVSAISADLSDKIRKHLSSFTEREQPKDH